MITKPQAQLEMQWILEEGRLRSLWTANQPQLFEPNAAQASVEDVQVEAA